MILHLLNKSPEATSCINRCVSSIGADDSLLLFEDGVYCLQAGCLPIQKLIADGLNKVYAHKQDLLARGISANVPNGITLIDEKMFVTLCCVNSKTISWF